MGPSVPPCSIVLPLWIWDFCWKLCRYSNISPQSLIIPTLFWVCFFFPEANSYNEAFSKYLYSIFTGQSMTKWLGLLVTVPLDDVDMGWTSVDWIEGKQGYIMRFKLGKPWVHLIGLGPRQRGASWCMLMEESIERCNWAMLDQWEGVMGLIPSRLGSRFLKSLLFNPRHFFHTYFWKPFLCPWNWWYVSHICLVK